MKRKLDLSGLDEIRTTKIEFWSLWGGVKLYSWQKAALKFIMDSKDGEKKD